MYVYDAKLLLANGQLPVNSFEFVLNCGLFIITHPNMLVPKAPPYAYFLCMMTKLH